MTTLFTILEGIISFEPAEAKATLMDINRIVRYAESLDAEIDSDQAIKIQQAGLQCLKRLAIGDSILPCLVEAKHYLDGD